MLTDMIAQNVVAVQAEIVAACQRSGRPVETIKLIGISKTHPAEMLLAALQAGLRHLGENRVEEAAPKIATVLSSLPSNMPAPTWHMVGHVQSRKAKSIIETFDVIHSLDNLKLAQRYNAFAQEQNVTREVLLEINISGEESKEGIPAQNWQNDADQRQNLWSLVQEISQLSHIRLVGLMTMAPYYAEPEATRPVFAGLRGLRDALMNEFPQLTWQELSMGMTNDYVVAIEEGATMVRVGRAIFGERE
ncbi:MAG: YggS family pyridoxal phosphate-dependent enzyme [Chloroflexi bacterium]|nr:YggS family pyridoxal phosphate-dependent enzyme [Chloroflexota bacterium]